MDRQSAPRAAVIMPAYNAAATVERTVRSVLNQSMGDLLLIAVRPDLQGTALNAVVMDHLYENCIKNGIRHAETGPQLETNRKVLSQWKMFHLEPHKRRRCYHKILDL